MKGKIIRVTPGAKKKDVVCIVCSEKGRKNKSLVELELGCRYHTEAYICNDCMGENDSRTGTIELPYLDDHFHIQGDQGRTFWDFNRVINGIYEFMQAPTPIQTAEGMWTVTTLGKVIMFFKCRGQPS